METFYSNVFLGNFSFLCFSIPSNNKPQKVAPFQRNILSVLNISSFFRHTDKQTKRARVISEGLTHTHHTPTHTHHTHTHTHTHTTFRYVTLMSSSQSLLHNTSDLFSFAFNLTSDFMKQVRSKELTVARQSTQVHTMFMRFYY